MSGKRKPKREKRRTIFSRPIMLHVCKDGTVSYRDASKREKIFNGVALPVFSVDTVEEAEQIRCCRRMYQSHPEMKRGTPWYILFSGDVDDLDRVSAEFATFYSTMQAACRRRDYTVSDDKRIPQIVEGAIAMAKMRIKIMNPAERVEFFEAILGVCCRHCGTVAFNERGELIDPRCRCDDDPEKD